MDFIHLIITRVNTRLAWASDKLGDPLRTEAWMDYRLDLFRRTCLPSIMEQSCQNFRWLVLFDEGTLPKHRQQIEEFTRDCPVMEPLFLPETFEDFIPAFTGCNRDGEVLTDYIPQGMEALLTTRIDSDDLFHHDAVKVIQENVEGRGPYFLNPLHGYLLNEKQVLHRVEEPSSPFLTFVEPIEAGELVKTVWCIGHLDAHAIAPIRQIEGGPWWMRVAHERNFDPHAIGDTPQWLRHLKGLGRKFLIRTGLAPETYRPRYLRRSRRKLDDILPFFPLRLR